MRYPLFSRLQLIGLTILAVALPFELKTPIIALGPIVITNVEAILYALIVLWAVSVWRTRRIHWTLVHSALFAWLIIQFLAAIFAPVEREAALKFALRSVGGALLFFIAADGIRASRQVAWIMSALSIGAVLSALAGWLEYSSAAAQTALLVFKTQSTLVGGEVRASGTFQYANTAAMYWEAALPLLIAVGAWWTIERAQRRWLIIALGGSLILVEAIILSASRAAWVGAALAVGAMIVVDRAAHRQAALMRPAAFALIVLVALIGAQLLINPIFITRLRSESDDTWFQAEIQVAPAELSASAGEVITQTIVVTNTSIRTWPAGGAQPVHISYHWIQPGTRRVLILDGARTVLPRDLAPGEAAAVTAWAQVPALTGTLLLQWDLVQENVTWFSERGNSVDNVSVVIMSTPKVVRYKFPAGSLRLSNTPSPPRSALWRAGLQMWLLNPLLGIGPDNFRHVYGPYLGQTEFDDRITANSWYVEVLATTGLVGLIAGLVVIVALALIGRRNWRRLITRGERALAIGLSAALLTFLVHGTVDYFMEFTPTYSLFWLTAGLLVGFLTGTHDAEITRAADRV